MSSAVVAVEDPDAIFFIIKERLLGSSKTLIYTSLHNVM